jgi:RimJ/RimL family protein N-acetyltransferase
MGTFEIRTLTTDEWAILRDLRFASLRDAPDAFTSTVEREEGYPREGWQLRTGTSAIAFAAGQPVGIAGWHRPDGADDTELVGMWVHPTHRGTGIALAIVEHVVTATRGEPLILHVLPTNERAQALYRKAGFVAEGTDVVEDRPLLRMRHGRP